jgi:hypothetical protein
MLQHKSRFKNYLISHDSLGKESQELVPAFRELQQVTSEHKLKPAEQVLLFILIYLFQRKGDLWMMTSGQRNSRDKGIGVRLDSILPRFACLSQFKSTEFLLGIVAEYRIRRLPQAIFDVIGKWGRGQCDLVLWTQIPTPLEMLDCQSRGRRIVSLNLEKAARGELVDGHRDAFEFLLHDLLHADLFFSDSESHQQQKSFFTILKNVIEQENLLESADDLFLKDLAYLMSDMNSHRAHLEAHFRAILIAFRLRIEKRSPQAALSAQGLDWVQRVTI